MFVLCADKPTTFGGKWQAFLSVCWETLEISQSYEPEESLKPKNVSCLDLKDFLSIAQEYLQDTLESGKQIVHSSPVGLMSEHGTCITNRQIS